MVGTWGVLVAGRRQENALAHLFLSAVHFCTHGAVLARAP